ncbi:hypothetical protein CASFOL_037157 [Castilleja foliolosa]|uniref:BHLH domain-containing protein n=1 Tax=Castilleja foliolosa TaxID=1961234 RepID=A0ABD3BNS4_9LAMI
MDYSFDHDEADLADIFGQGFDEHYKAPNMINILSSNTITSMYNFPTITPLIQRNYNNKPIITNNNPSKLPRTNPAVINNNDDSAAIFLPPHEQVENAKRISRATKKKTRTRPPDQVYEHIIAERRRREQLSQLFIALSAIVPGLKKTDKTSILGYAIEYLKNLKQKVQNLEQKSTRKLVMDSRVTIKKLRFSVDEEGSSDERSSPEIEVRVVNNNILIRAHCRKQKGILANLLSKVESLNMVVVNTNVTPFGDSTLDITIVAEMQKGFSLTVKEVAEAIRAAFISA